VLPSDGSETKSVLLIVVGRAALSYPSMGLCQRVFGDNPNMGLFPYALFDLLALAFGIAAAASGSK
jgi:hypothetical protein